VMVVVVVDLVSPDVELERFSTINSANDFG
jgi:hypothetical protein